MDTQGRGGTIKTMVASPDARPPPSTYPPEVVSPRSSRRSRRGDGGGSRRRRRSSSAGGGSSSSQSRSRSRSRSRRRDSSRSQSRSRRRRDGSERRGRSRRSQSGSRSRRRRRDAGDASSPPAGTPAYYPDAHLPTTLDSRRRAYQSEPFKVLRCYDENDRAPEDRLRLDLQGAATPEFDTSCPVVRGTLSIEGVNYSTFEAHKKEKPHYADRFLDAVRDDIISEVGNGVRRDDIALRVYPGAVRTVVLQYDEGSPGRIAAGTWTPAAPKLMNADWAFTVDYAVRARNNARQQRIAQQMYQALSSEHGLSTYKTCHAYVKWLDPTYGDAQRVVMQRPTLDPDLVSSSQPFNAARDPPATRAVSPHRNVPVDGVYPSPAPRHGGVVGTGRSLGEQQQALMHAAHLQDAGIAPGHLLHHHAPGTPEVQHDRARLAEVCDALSPHSAQRSPFVGSAGPRSAQHSLSRSAAATVPVSPPAVGSLSFMQSSIVSPLKGGNNSVLQ